ncbi:HYR domain-containing protein [Muriicola sp. Z0-33]|uniref:HYR domain-containing protein n=1 Tax=Muriicola sp. Z0-33 TaxID=2816957 RepID=UPI0022387446|nr:HYR domain-containing protein [Muriicola sp. Z0-33]MCW5517435.1 HYR domain-containing protein [Muriicola sp. Z0-33]
MKKITLLLAVLLCSFHISAQTTLAAGDIAFIGSNVEGATNADDSFAFVLLVDVELGTEIIFTDRGWDNTAGAFTSFNGDGEFTWKASSALTTGTIVTLDMSGLFPAAYALIGDQLFAIQGSIGAPTFIAGLQYNEIATGGTDGNWDGEATTNSTSELPIALTNGDTAVRLITAAGEEQDNWQFSCTLAGGSPLEGTPAEIRAIVHNRAFWNSSDDTAYNPAAEAGCSFVVEECAVNIDTQPIDAQVCEGATNIDFVVQATGAGTLSYNWEFSEDGGATFNDVNPSADGNPTLTLAGPLSAAANGNQYRVVVTSDNGTPATSDDDCEEISSVVTLTVNPLPTVTFTAIADLSIDAGVQPGLGGGSPSGGVYSGPGVTDDGNGMTYSFDPAAAGEGVHTLTYTINTGDSCDNSANDDVEVIGLASITIKKLVTGAGADADQQFEFFYNSSISGLLGTFYLSQSGISSPEAEGGEFNVPGGNLFQFREENLPEGYDVSDIQFSSANGNTTVSALDIPGNEIQFIIAQGDDVTVTFVNSFTPPLPPSMANDITSFTVPGQIGTSDIDATAKTVEILVPNGTVVTALIPSIAVSLDATVSPDSGVSQDFTNPVIYTVTAEDGTMQPWTVTVRVQILVDLELEMSVDNLTPVVGDKINFTFTLTNKGPGSATGVTVKSLFPNGYSATGAGVVNGGTYHFAPRGEWEFGNPILPGTTATLTLEVIVNPSGDYLHLAEVIALNEFDIDSSPGNGVDTDGDNNVVDDPDDEDDGDGVITTPQDITAPSIICPGDIVVSNDPGQCGAVVNFTVTASDDRPGLTLVVSPASGSFFPVGTTMVTATATDLAGNIAQCSFNVTVNDNEAPVIVCPADITVDVPFGETGAIVNFAPTATDNCPGVGVSAGPMSGSFFALGTTAVNATATDAAGNFAGCTFNVTVNELPPTVLTVLDFVLVNADTNTDIGPIANGDIIDVTTLPTMNLNIRAEATADTESVRLELSGAQSNGRTENVAPFALFGDNAGNYAAHVFALGAYDLTATPYSENGLGGTEGTGLAVSFEFVNPAVVSPLIVVDATTDTELFGLTEGLVINKSITGDIPFGIIFSPAFNPNGVRFSLSGPLTENRSEGSSPPYSLFGDIGIDIQGKMFPEGSYTLVANPNSGPTVTVNFEVVDVDPVCADFEANFGEVDNPADCGTADGSIELIVSGFQAPLQFNWSHDATLNTALATGLDLGDYSVTVTDANGCSKTLMTTLYDTKAPTPICINGLAIELGPDGSMTVLPSDFIAAPIPDLCGEITYSLSKDTFTCSDIGTVPIRVIATDGSGNSDYCETFVIVQDNLGICTDNSVTGFVLVDADSNTDLMTIVEGAVIDLANLPTNNLNIRANVGSGIESVGFSLSGAQSNTRTENVPPYALFGDNGGNYFAHTFAVGSYSLTATPYTGNNKGGTPGTSGTVNFEFIDGSPVFFTIKLYPNPAVEQIKIDVDDPKVKMRSVTVHDVRGRAMSSTDTGFLSAGEDFTLPVRDLPAGVYYLSVVNSKGFTHQQPFIVRK